MASPAAPPARASLPVTRQPQAMQAARQPQAAAGGGTGAQAGAGRRDGVRRALRIGLAGVFVGSVTLLALMVGMSWLRRQAYDDLSADMPIQMDVASPDAQFAEAEAPSRDWAALIAENPDIRYWMTVDGKPIDYPLVQHEYDQEWYLKHDFWGGYDIYGTLFIDVREEPTARHLLTYGHHITGSDRMYSSVNKSWDQARFDEIGTLTLEAPPGEAGVTRELFRPAFAMEVDQSYQTIQEFDFATDGEFRAWLAGMAAEATAKSPDCDWLCGNARRALSFVTCASDTPNQRGRTIVVFVATEPPA